MPFDTENQNFEYIIQSNTNKLRLIQRGWDPVKVFTVAERKLLVDEEILVYKSINDDLYLSDEAEKMLNEIYQNEI